MGRHRTAQHKLECCAGPSRAVKRSHQHPHAQSHIYSEDQPHKWTGQGRIPSAITPQFSSSEVRLVINKWGKVAQPQDERHRCHLKAHHWFQPFLPVCVYLFPNSWMNSPAGRFIHQQAGFPSAPFQVLVGSLTSLTMPSGDKRQVFRTSLAFCTL